MSGGKLQKINPNRIKLEKKNLFVILNILYELRQILKYSHTYK